MGKATQDLRNEHDAILFVLQILDKMMQSKEQSKETMLQYYGEFVYFLQIFADKCHHGKEELYLFQEMVRQGIANEGGPIGVMLEEHVRGRGYIAHMSHALEGNDLIAFHDAAVKYRDLLRQHIEKENSILFRMADRIIEEKDQNALFEQFEQYEESVIGHGVHEKLHAMIDVWAEAFGVE